MAGTPLTTEEHDQLLTDIYVYALEPANYAAGWDSIYEATTREELTELLNELGGATTLDDALDKLRRGVEIRKSYGDDIRATAF